jgi:hypothetical protein
MRLVADSIAQQRQIASFSLIIHPACIAGMVAVFAALYKHHPRRDLGTTMVLVCGIIIAYLAGVRLLTASYIRIAESFKWKEWVTTPEGQEDYILAAMFGEELIATTVLRIVAPAGSTKKTRSSAVKNGSGVIRAWTTKYRYRNKGIGGDMLRLAILTTRSKCGDDAKVSFDPAHANSARPLPEMFSRTFINREQRAYRALDHALEACDSGESTFKMQ